MSCDCSTLSLDATIGGEADLRRVVRTLRLALGDGTLEAVGGGAAVADLAAGRAEGQVEQLYRCRACSAHFRLSVDATWARGSFTASDAAPAFGPSRAKR